MRRKSHLHLQSHRQFMIFLDLPQPLIFFGTHPPSSAFRAQGTRGSGRLKVRGSRHLFGQIAVPWRPRADVGREPVAFRASVAVVSVPRMWLD